MHGSEPERVCHRRRPLRRRDASVPGNPSPADVRLTKAGVPALTCTVPVCLSHNYVMHGENTTPERQVDVPAEADGERLDVFLTARVPEASRAVIQRWIQESRVLVNWKSARSGHKVYAGDRVVWEPPPPAAAPTHAPDAIPLDILFEDQDLVVLNKPAGMVVHPAPGHPGGTLVNALVAHFGTQPAGPNDRPGIVHRLDRDTSGVMLAARTDQALRSLQRQLAARTISRRYVALVRGSPRFDEVTVDAPIGRNPSNRQRMAVIPPGSPQTAREAVTHIRILERLGGFTLVDAVLETGRTHQIRVHCAYIRLPVVGDPFYGPRGLERDPLIPAPVRGAVGRLAGQALHAYAIRFTHPSTGAELCFTAPPPDDLAALLLSLGSTRRPWEQPIPATSPTDPDTGISG